MKYLLAERRSSVGLMFALGAIPIIGLVGVAVDFGIWNQTNSTLSVAANVAAMTAVKIAASAQLAVDPNAQTEGQQAGAQWFQAEVGAARRVGTEGVRQQAVAVNVSMGTPTSPSTVSANVAYSGYVPSVFGGIFGTAQYWVSGQATAQVTTAPYLNVEILIDNSSSMDIGATQRDMQLLNNISACDASNAVYTGNQQQSLDPYDSYQYSGYGRVYDGTLTTPAVQTGLLPSPQLLQQASPPGTDPPCQGVLPKQADGTYPLAGPPCAFACHWDSNPGHNNGLATDLYGMARRTLGTANPITLRLDIVKNATNQVITAMQQDNLQINNLNVGLFTFNTTLNQIYPGSGEAGGDWSAAQAAVGTPPSGPYVSETGILPVVGYRQGTHQPNNDDTNFPEAMAGLTSTYLTTPSGTGVDVNHPRKVLFIITDGFLDDTSGARSAFDPASCAYIKNTLGYTIYVVYTPYYPVQHQAYLSNNWSAIVKGTGPGSITYNLNACSSSPSGSTSDFIAATDAPTLNAALQTFLKQALNQPAKFTN